VEVHHDGLSTRLAPDTELAAYRIIQEALTNVARHAHASFCRVALRRDASDLEITVDDDGRGFDPAGIGTDSHDHGLGLVNMRERASQLDGRLALQSTRGAGTRVHVWLPLKAMPADNLAGETADPAVATGAWHV
jgi:two-component system sensor histidine kinase UhpB